MSSVQEGRLRPGTSLSGFYVPCWVHVAQEEDKEVLFSIKTETELKIHEFFIILKIEVHTWLRRLRSH